MKKSDTTMIVGIVVLAGLVIWSGSKKTATPSPLPISGPSPTPPTPAPSKLNWVSGDIIVLGGSDIYTVRGVDNYQLKYLLAEGRWPNDVLSYNWVDGTYIDRISTFIEHVDIFYWE